MYIKIVIVVWGLLSNISLKILKKSLKQNQLNEDVNAEVKCAVITDTISLASEESPVTNSALSFYTEIILFSLINFLVHLLLKMLVYTYHYYK